MSGLHQAAKTSTTLSVDEEEALIRKWITPDPRKRGRSEAIIAGQWVHVWALVGHLPAANGDPAGVAKAYQLPLDAVLAALAYYRRNREIIDERLRENEAD